MEHRRIDADAVLRQYAARAREERVAVRLRGDAGQPARSGTGSERYRLLIRYSAVAAACLVLGLFVLLQPSQKVYAYVNDVPLTSKEEARVHARQMFDDLAVGMAPADEVLGSLFSL